jgi:hypothetical protein
MFFCAREPAGVGCYHDNRAPWRARADKVNLNTPNRFVNTAGFGTITNAMDPARQIQLSARISF